jgi:hypothetical protein
MTIFLTPLIVMIRAVQLGTQQWLIKRLCEAIVEISDRGNAPRERRDVPKIALLRRIDDEILVDSEQITTPNALALVGLLSPIRDLLPNELPNVLDDHLAGRDVPAKQDRLATMFTGNEAKRTHSMAKRP